MPSNTLDLFHSVTSSWFRNTLGKPTEVQQEAWPAIARGDHALVSAPTGTGKTLSAFLIFLDQLKKEAREGSLKQELQLIYVSPLKALAADIRENLNRPLEGIEVEEKKAGITTSQNINVAIRTGDTPQKERQRMIRKPPHILITTPESLYLMLTSKSGLKILRTARAIILDELHVMIDSKRGAHLMLSIARLDKLCPNPLQRIGLSATIEPLDLAANYLSPDSVTIVAPKMKKHVRIEITSPRSVDLPLGKDPLWQELASTVYAYCQNARSVIAFVDGRAYSEKLAFYVNQIAGEGFARTHHGSLSKEHRFEVEQSLREGKLRLLCATSSMELGIDVGEIDQVFQIGCPYSISSTMQRLGRAGHNPNRTSIMHIFPRTASEALYCGLTAQVVRDGGVEYSKPPTLCFDVLAQHLVSMATGDGYDVDEVMAILPRAYPFIQVTKEDVISLLCMLSGDYEHKREIPVRPRILYDRLNQRVEGDPYSRMLAISTGGTIPDRGLYAVKTQNNVKIGELDEEFIFESRVGDTFLLGSFAWQITNIDKDAVIVAPSNSGSGRLPYWNGDYKGRCLQVGLAFGNILRNLSNAHSDGTLTSKLIELGLDEIAVEGAEEFIGRQIASTEILPDDRTILVEYFKDDTGNYEMMVHSIFGRKVNEPLALLALEVAKGRTRTNVSSVTNDDGFLLFSYGKCQIPDGILQSLSPASARNIIRALLPTSPFFNINFRYIASRALMMGVRRGGRQPLWVQRIRSADMLDSLIRYENHPLIREAKRECLEDYWDLDGVEYILNGIQTGTIEVREMYHEVPSPMSFLLRKQTEASMMYDHAATTLGIQNAALDALKQSQMITPLPEQLERVQEREKLPENSTQLHSLLLIEGDLIAGELEVPIDWLEELAKNEKAKYIEPGLWIAIEHEQEYEIQNSKEVHIEESRQHIIRRLLRYRGAHTIEQISNRYLWSISVVENLLTDLCNQSIIVEREGLYYYGKLFDRARAETIKSLRRQVKTLPSHHYVAMITNGIRTQAPNAQQLEETIKQMSNVALTPNLWESVIFPSRVKNYSPNLLDQVLTNGEYYWQLNVKKELSFGRYDDIDWDMDIHSVLNSLEGNEKVIYEALLKRGASYMQSLTNLIEDHSPYDTLLDLMEKGLVCADSFLPIRQWLNRDKMEKASAKHRVNAKVMALKTGRWELVRQVADLSIEQKLNRIFDTVIIISRETIQGRYNLTWVEALETLRIWEYTGRVRRGYFIEGLSGIQFIRDEDYERTMLRLEKINDQMIWLPAVDPAQLYGKCIPHIEGRSFVNIPGTVVALRAGIPVAVFERQGKILRIFDDTHMEEALSSFVNDYKNKRIYTTLNRIVVKDYPEQSAILLKQVGFKHEIQDYVFYR